jgi:capsular polysaccharide biosynthesis protein/Mrp family chromosome partitioning ATPase
MELSKILNILYRYLWLFVLTIVAASLTTFLVLNRQPTLYKATTQLLVGPTLDSPSPDLNSLKIGSQLIQTYAELVGTHAFLVAVNDQLNPKMDLNTLDAMITTRQNTETRILTINVRGEDPKQTVAIANAAAQALVEMSPAKDNTAALLRSQMSDQSHQLEGIVASSETTIQQLETELTKLKSAAPSTPEATKANVDQQNLVIRQLADERSRLSDALRTLASVYQVLLDTNTNQLEIIESAQIASEINQNLMTRVATSAFTGLALALIIVFIAEFADDRIRFPRDLSKAAGTPLLSAIDKYHHSSAQGLPQFVSYSDPDSQAANNYREAVAKLLFSMGETLPQTLMLSSVESHSGYDAAAATANLAIAFAKAGSRVVLVDAQFHNPVLSRAFQATDTEGFIDAAVANTAKPHLVAIDEVPGLRFLPVGVASEKSSSVMLNSSRIAKLFDALQQDTDILLIAGAPILWFSESLALASRSNAVILVAHSGDVRAKTLNKVVETLRDMKIRLAGVLFDYNASSFVPGTEAVTALGRIASKATSLKNTVALRFAKNNISEQTTKS